MNAIDSKEVISTLNDLIETSKDGEEGFRTCAEDIKRPELKSLFSERAAECAKAAQELQAIVIRLGGDPEDSTSVSGDLHRRWVDLKSLVTGKDDEAILNECERGEDVAKRSYRKALDKALPEDIRQVVQRQYDGVLRNHDQVKMLRDAERARS
ncbi:PA2169 family four-helix-bundle protein [Halopseudomonas sp. SMJS2]|uniref:ferritin-like domain-containing protein n=1 Tax=Halopseudomonas sp. SMJS2 TaxID=3041098 RepID=UPI0024536BAD|nr:PA2169 family four-helix-bundle protein [Halopseudomonas sp. SMJS2]WGK60781.1 PA2169 family four-helix-bundle protein [Halopseudomonas sp. SMJS2]